MHSLRIKFKLILYSVMSSINWYQMIDLISVKIAFSVEIILNKTNLFKTMKVYNVSY